MFNSITIPSDSGTYTFPNANVNLTDHDGFGIPFPKTSEHEYSMSHGGLFLQQYYKTRRVMYAGYVKTDDIATFESAWRDFANAMSFDNATKLIKSQTFGGLNFQFTAIVATELKKIQQVGMLNYCQWQIEMDVPDPIFYSQTA